MTKSIEAAAELGWDFYWTLERYHRAIDNGTLTEDDKVELLYGKIADLMPAGTLHEECVNILSEFFQDKFGKEYRYREEKSIAIPDLVSEPEPDFVVVVKKSYGKNRPTPDEIHLVVEVAKSSLQKDRTIKVELYAEANLSEYWIINLVNRQIEVYLKPQPDQKLYGSVNRYKASETFISPFAGEVIVADLLPNEEED